MSELLAPRPPTPTLGDPDNCRGRSVIAKFEQQLRSERSWGCGIWGMGGPICFGSSSMGQPPHAWVSRPERQARRMDGLRKPAVVEVYSHFEVKQLCLRTREEEWKVSRLCERHMSKEGRWVLGGSARQAVPAGRYTVLCFVYCVPYGYTVQNSVRSQQIFPASNKRARGQEGPVQPAPIAISSRAS